jgi:hypothetical protein
MATALLGEFDAQGCSDPARTRQAVLEKLAQLSQDEEVPAAVQLQASVWLGKANHVRLFTEEKREGLENQNIDDVRIELSKAIRELFISTECTTTRVIDIQAEYPSPTEDPGTVWNPGLLERQ